MNKELTISVKMSETERAVIQAAAEADERFFSAYVRNAAIAAAERQLGSRRIQLIRKRARTSLAGDV